MFYAGIAEAGFFDPVGAVGAGVVEAAGVFDEHVEAHHETEGVLRTVIVDDGIVDNEGSAGLECVVGLADGHLLFVEVPVVEGVTHGDDVDVGKRLGEEISGLEADAAVKAVGFGVLLEDGRAFREIVAYAVEVRVGEGDLDGEVALCGANVSVGFVVGPANLFGDGDVWCPFGNAA